MPASIVPILLSFAPLLTAPTWRHAQVLVTGTLLAQGPRTVAAALRVMGLAHEPRFEPLCLWHTPGWPPLPIRWMLVVDPADPLAPEAFFTTDLIFTTDLSVLPVRIIEWFVSRWSIEVTFAAVRRHLGVET